MLNESWISRYGLESCLSDPTGVWQFRFKSSRRFSSSPIASVAVVAVPAAIAVVTEAVAIAEVAVPAAIAVVTVVAAIAVVTVPAAIAVVTVVAAKR